MALRPNINLDVDPEREKAAYEAAQNALKLSANAPEHERAYIKVLAKRYSIDPKADLKKLAVDYKNAMGELVNVTPMISMRPHSTQRAQWIYDPGDSGIKMAHRRKVRMRSFLCLNPFSNSVLIISAPITITFMRLRRRHIRSGPFPVPSD